jgi:hypothetical protein
MIEKIVLGYLHDEGKNSIPNGEVFMIVCLINA